MTSYYNGKERNGDDYSNSQGGGADGVRSIAEGSVPSVSLFDFIEEVLRPSTPQHPKASRRSPRTR